jgi:hypothetical protein
MMIGTENKLPPCFRDNKSKEGAMQVGMISSIIGSHLFLECGWVLACQDGETTDDVLARIYGIFVDNYIHKCEAKAELRNAGSFRIRRSAMRANGKADFMKSNRTTLITYLIDKNVSFKAYRIEYHLNRKYAESLQPHDVYTALLKEYVDQ